MAIYTYVGTVLPDTTRVSSPRVTVNLQAGPDYPPVVVHTQIVDNRIISSCDLNDDVSEVGIASLRNIVQDLASSICDSASILQGAWTIVTIDTCINPDGTIRERFSNTSQYLKDAFEKYSVTPEQVMEINLHTDGYFLRLALDDINSGLIEVKFMRSHFYRAVESLRHAVCQSHPGLTAAQSWTLFRNELEVSREDIELFAHHAERHGDYANAVPLSGSEVNRILDGVAKLISRYVIWFRAQVGR